MLITEQNRELVLEQGISKIPGGKTFLGIASKLGITPDPSAFVDFTIETTKAGLKFFKDKLVSLSQTLAGTLATIASSAYAYYGYKAALSKDIEELLINISKDPKAFKAGLIKSTDAYGDTDLLYRNLTASVYTDAIIEIIEELRGGFEKNLAQIKIKRILASITDTALHDEYQEFFDIKKKKIITDLHKRFILNNLELRTKFHKDNGHPFMWLAIVKAKVIPISVPGKSNTSSIKWSDPDAVKVTGLNPNWLQKGVKVEAIQALATAVSTDSKLRAQAKTILSKYSEGLKNGDEKEVNKILSTLEHNIENGLIFFGNEELVKEVIDELLVKNAITDERKNIAKRTLQALPRGSVLRTVLTKDIENVADDKPPEQKKEKPKPYTAEEIGASKFIGKMIGYNANGGVWKALLHKPIGTTKKLSTRPFIQKGPKLADALKIKRLLNQIQPYNVLNLDSKDDVYIKEYVKYISNLWNDITTTPGDDGKSMDITLDNLVRSFSSYTEHWFDINPQPEKITEVRVVDNTLIFEIAEYEYLVPHDKFFKIFKQHNNNDKQALFEFKDDKIFDIKLNEVTGNVHLLSQDWEYIAKYLH